jgi:hypothetical protein
LRASAQLDFEGAPFDCNFLSGFALAAGRVTTIFSRRRNQ